MRWRTSINMELWDWGVWGNPIRWFDTGPEGPEQEGQKAGRQTTQSDLYWKDSVILRTVQCSHGDKGNGVDVCGRYRVIEESSPLWGRFDLPYLRHYKFPLVHALKMLQRRGILTHRGGGQNEVPYRRSTRRAAYVDLSMEVPRRIWYP